ncbi:hypothetical protein ACFSR7_06470 [Cohnella sp. GCM10020058]|uniref:hypothetical protein n=1 Tax=Cohnella sp. GCM10020058 TaxID=3317330 RepID=UPI0036339734
MQREVGGHEEEKQTVRRLDRIVLNVLFVAFFVGVLSGALYGIRGELYLIVVVIVTMAGSLVRYNREMKIEGFATRKISGPYWKRRLVLEVTLMPVALGLLYGVLDGWDSAWRGLAFGLAISAGKIIFEQAERLYLRMVINR